MLIWNLGVLVLCDVEKRQKADNWLSTSCWNEPPPPTREEGWGASKKRNRGHAIIAALPWRGKTKKIWGADLQHQLQMKSEERGNASTPRCSGTWRRCTFLDIQTFSHISFSFLLSFFFFSLFFHTFSFRHFRHLGIYRHEAEEASWR